MHHKNSNVGQFRNVESIESFCETDDPVVISEAANDPRNPEEKRLSPPL